MKTSKHTWVRALVIFGLLMALLASAATAFAELTEAEKQALEDEIKAAELANESPEDQEIQDQEPPANEPPANEPPANEPPANEPPANEPPAPAEDPEPPAPPEPAEAPEPPAPPEAPEAPEAPQAPEPPGGGQDQGGGQAATERLDGYISAFSANSLTVGIIGNNTVTVTSRTFITNNGQVSNLYRGVFIGDTVSVQFDPATNEALRIEIEGFGFAATYQAVGVPITYIGAIGHWPQDFGMHAGGAGLKLGASTQVTVNGVPATIQDLQVGDTIDYVQSAIDLTALWVIVTR